MTSLIDPPESWDDLATWRAYRKELGTLTLEDDGVVQDAIVEADAEIARLESEETA